MSSKSDTILKKMLAQHLHSKGLTKNQIAKALFNVYLVDNYTGQMLSEKRVEQYLEKNLGLNKQSSTEQNSDRKVHKK